MSAAIPSPLVPPVDGFPVILSDPPWTFETYSEKGKEFSPERHYKCMTLPEIKALPVADVAARDCVLLMWAVDPLLDKAFEVIRAWGFKYKTVGFYWIKSSRGLKLHKGMGYWTRANPEVCLLATRGKPKRVSANVDRTVIAPLGRHSEKPHVIYDRIERLVAGPYLEMFARYGRPGPWWQWGNQVGLLGGAPKPFDLSSELPAIVAEPVQPSFEVA